MSLRRGGSAGRIRSYLPLQEGREEQAVRVGKGAGRDQGQERKREKLGLGAGQGQGGTRRGGDLLRDLLDGFGACAGCKCSWAASGWHHTVTPQGAS